VAMLKKERQAEGCRRRRRRRESVRLSENLKERLRRDWGRLRMRRREIRSMSSGCGRFVVSSRSFHWRESEE
jgi:hypothetical protein